MTPGASVIVMHLSWQRARTKNIDFVMTHLASLWKQRDI